MANSQYELLLALHLKELGLEFVQEYRFCSNRKFRADFFVPDNLLIEINGGVWTSGRHNRGQGYINDLEKINLAQSLGFVVLQFTTDQVSDGNAKEYIKNYLKERR